MMVVAKRLRKEMEVNPRNSALHFRNEANKFLASVCLFYICTSPSRSVLEFFCACLFVSLSVSATWSFCLCLVRFSLSLLPDRLLFRVFCLVSALWSSLRNSARPATKKLCCTLRVSLRCSNGLRTSPVLLILHMKEVVHSLSCPACLPLVFFCHALSCVVLCCLCLV